MGKDNLGASLSATRLAGADEAPEPPSRLGPADGIPCAAYREQFEELILPAFEFLRRRDRRELALRLVKLSVDFDKGQ